MHALFSRRNAQLQKKRQELAERSFAHMYETGAMRRLHLRGRTNILKRLVVHGAGFNLALYMRSVIGVGKPRQLTLTALRLLLQPLFRPVSRPQLATTSPTPPRTLGTLLPAPFVACSPTLALA